MNGGVTGHRQFESPDTVGWVRQAIVKAVIDNRIDYGFSCLAEGSDQLFAEVLSERLVPFTAIIPCDDYETSFTDRQGVEHFRKCLAMSRDTRRLGFSEPSDNAFLAASQTLVDSISVLIAIWDGKPSRGVGGTADVVRYAEQSGKRIVHINPLTRTVTADDSPIREPDQIRQDAARKLRAVQVSDRFQAILGCLLGENWTTPKLIEMVVTPDGHVLGRCEGDSSFKAFLGASEDLIKNIHGVAPVAELDGDEIGYLVGKVAEIKRQK